MAHDIRVYVENMSYHKLGETMSVIIIMLKCLPSDNRLVSLYVYHRHPRIHPILSSSGAGLMMFTYAMQHPMWCWPGLEHVLLNSLAPGKFEWNFRHVIFKQILVIDDWGISCEIALIWMSLSGLHWWSVNIGSGNDLVLSGNKPSPEPMLTQIFVTIWRH